MKRNSSIECIRVIAIITIIFIHVEGYLTYGLPAEFISHLGHFAIVFFMITAGYFWGKKVRTGEIPQEQYTDYSARILKIFLFWCLFYILVPHNVRDLVKYLHAQHHSLLSTLEVPYWRIVALIEKGGHPLRGVIYLFLVGTKYHLWFLMGLVWASMIAAMLIKWNRDSWLIWIGVIFYLSEAVSRFLIAAWSVFPISFNERYGPFFSTIFFAIGWRLSAHKGPFKPRPAILLLSAGFAVLALDMIFVHNLIGFRIVEPFLETTLGIGAALLALASPSLGNGTRLASLGRYVLGIYVIHPFFIDFLMPLAIRMPARIQTLAFPMIVFFVSTITVVACSKISVLRPFFVGSRKKVEAARGMHPDPLSARSSR
jgi:surface polysaccharide O-acyltransferase-like enzyme